MLSSLKKASSPKWEGAKCAGGSRPSCYYYYHYFSQEHGEDCSDGEQTVVKNKIIDCVLDGYSVEISVPYKLCETRGCSYHSKFCPENSICIDYPGSEIDLRKHECKCLEGFEEDEGECKQRECKKRRILLLTLPTESETDFTEPILQKHEFLCIM